MSTSSTHENTSLDIHRLSLRISGRVQGVGYRYFTRECAISRRITGWVKNCMNGDVECEAQGQNSFLQLFIQELKKGPLFGHVTNLNVKEIPIAEKETTFSIRY